MSKEITVYSQTTCNPCKVVKLYLNNHDIQYTEKNIDEPNNRVEFDKLGFKSTPVTIIDGECIIGPDIDKLDELLR